MVPQSKTNIASVEAFNLPCISDLGGSISSGGFDTDDMTKIWLESGDKEISPRAIKSAMPVCIAWSRTHSGVGADIVEQIVAKVAEERIAGNEVALSIPWPNLCTVAIDAWATSGEKGAAERAEELLGKIEVWSSATPEEDGESNGLNIISYNAVLKAYGRQASEGDTKATYNAFRILCQLVDGTKEDKESPLIPNTISYTSVIDAYAKAGGGEAAEGAERVFRMMEREYKAGCADARPGVQSFNTVINAWVQSGKANGALRAEEILKKMISLHEEGIDDIEPTIVSFTTCINGWAKSGQDRAAAATRALAIFELMEKMREAGTISARPNKFTYSSLVDALVKGRQLQKAEDIYNRMVEEYEEDNSRPIPGKIQATQIMDGWAKSGEGTSGIKVEVLLTTLERLYTTYGIDAMKPSVITYCAAINAWAKGKAFGKARKARETLDRMIEAYESGNTDARPNTTAFTAVLNACAFTQGDIVEKKEALMIAASAYKDLCLSDYGEPNQYTFATFMRVCSNIIPQGPQRASSMKSVLEKAAETGMVDELVLKILQNSLYKDQLESMLPCKLPAKGLSLSDLPAKWSCNVHKAAQRGRGDRRRRK